MNKLQNQSKQSDADAMSDCVIPEDIMFSILTRLPVKSLLRFKSVCKPWLKLLTTPTFIKLHRRQFSDDPKNQNFMIWSLSTLSKPYFVHTMSLFKNESDEKKPIDLDHPFLEILYPMNFVGCCNGLVCMAFPQFSQDIFLWNPATRMSKFVRAKVDRTEIVSVGFGYDEGEDDFKVVVIAYFPSQKMRVAAEVYSAKFDSWKTIKNGDLGFNVLSTKNNAVVGGDPYWIANVDENVSKKSQIVRFDVKKMVFKIMPSSNLDLGRIGWDWINVVPLMEWKGSLASIVCLRHGYTSYMNLYVFDKNENIWNVKHIFGPISLKIYKCLQCFTSGKIIGVCFDGKLFEFDPERGGVKVIEVEEAHMMSFQICEYRESLVCIDGMEPMNSSENGGRRRSYLVDETSNGRRCWVFAELTAAFVVMMVMLVSSYLMNKY